MLIVLINSTMHSYLTSYFKDSYFDCNEFHVDKSA